MLHDILLILLGLVIGAIIGFVIARTVTKKYLVYVLFERNMPENFVYVRILQMQGDPRLRGNLFTQCRQLCLEFGNLFGRQVHGL